MKNNFIIILLSCFILSCKQDNTKQENLRIEAEPMILDSTYYGNMAQQISGLYKSERKQDFLINICAYKESMIEGMDLSKETIDSLLLPYSIENYKFRNIPVRKDKYGNIDNKIYRIYYEITNLNTWNKEKVVGRLYQLGSSREIDKYVSSGQIYVSDTTSKYGWFILTNVMELGWGKNTEIVQDKIEIMSKNPKAQKLCGFYDKVSNKPYRIIKDEELD